MEDKYNLRVNSLQVDFKDLLQKKFNNLQTAKAN